MASAGGTLPSTAATSTMLTTELVPSAVRKKTQVPPRPLQVGFPLALPKDSASEWERDGKVRGRLVDGMGGGTARFLGGTKRKRSGNGWGVGREIVWDHRQKRCREMR